MMQTGTPNMQEVSRNRTAFVAFTFVVVCFASSTHFFARFRRASQPSNALVQNSGGSSGGGCLLSLTSTRVLSHSDARARFEHLHISRQGCCCGVTGTLSYMDAGFIFKCTGASKRSLDTQEWPHTSDTTLSAYRHS